LRGEKAHTSKRVSIIACNNVISKVQCATHRPEGNPYQTPKKILYAFGKEAHINKKPPKIGG